MAGPSLSPLYDTPGFPPSRLIDGNRAMVSHQYDLKLNRSPDLLSGSSPIVCCFHHHRILILKIRLSNGPMLLMCIRTRSSPSS